MDSLGSDPESQNVQQIQRYRVLYNVTFLGPTTPVQAFVLAMHAAYYTTT